MANVNSVSSNSYSNSLYGTRNVLTGLATGMDTESMIQNSVSSYQTKITSLEQDKTKLEWKQDAYREITDQLIDLNNTYTSFTSKSNLFTSSFYTKTTVETKGENAAAVSATGKPTSTVTLNSVSRLATSAQLNVSAEALRIGGNMSYGDIKNAKIGDLLAGKTGWGSDANGEGKRLLKINDTEIGWFDENTSLSTILSAINSSDAGVTASFSTVSGTFQFTSKDVGESAKIDFGTSGLASDLFTQVSGEGNRKLSEVFDNDFTWDSSDVAAFYLTDGTTDWKLDPLDKDATLADLRQAMQDATGSTDFDMSKLSVTDGLTGQKLELSKVFADPKEPVHGENAVLNVNVNGRNIELSESSNRVEIDGMTIQLKQTFNEDVTIADNKPLSSGVTFDAKADTQQVIDGLKSFIDQYNSAVRAIHSAYTTQPLEKSSSSHAKYEPLTEKDKEGLSDSAIEKLEAKAKTGLLYGDGDLSRLYNELNGIFTTGPMASKLKEIGISVDYDSTTRVSTLSLDTEKLTTALEDDANAVAKVFTGSVSAETGEKTSGIMESVRSTLTKYANTSSGSPGILVQRAGTTKASNSLLQNDLLTQINKKDEEIAKWQSRMSSQVDYYTQLFSKLEQMTNTMNSQSSMFSGLMGG